MKTQDIIRIIKNNNAGISAIVVPTKLCNLKCKYCYITNKSNSMIMDNKVLKETISKIIQYNGKERISKFIWHGGEPLIAGIDFFKNIIDIQQEYLESGFKIKNSIQTNLLLLDDDYIDFFISNKFTVGSSLDGLEENHDYFRGIGTFKKVLERYFYARKRGLGIGFICVLNRNNKNKVKIMYEFFRDNDIPVSFTPMFPNNNDMSLLLSPEEYFLIIKELFDLWYWDKKCKIRINPCDGILQGILLKGITLSCTYSKNCIEHYFSIVPNGDVFPCNRFVEKEEYKIGNISENSFEEILNSPLRVKLLNRSAENINDCKECEYIEYCKAGCMNHALLFYGDIFKRDYYCHSFYRAFDYAMELVNKSLYKLKEDL